MSRPTNTKSNTFHTANRPNPWSILKHRDYRLFWLGQTVSSVGTFMQVVGQSLLVLKLSHNSALALGLVSLAQALAFFAFALIGGSIVDRVNRRKLLFITQTLLLGLALVLAIVSATNTATLPLVIVLAFCSGVVVSFDQPARASLFPLLVPREELQRATALNALAMTSAGTFGPALAGFTAATLGLTLNFSLNALSFVFALVCLALIRAKGQPQDIPLRQPLLGSVLDGLRVVASHSGLLRVVLGYGALLLLGPSPSVLLPLYAAQILHVGGVQLGLLFLMIGAGTLIASAVQATFGGNERQGVFVMSLFVWACALAVFALSSSLMLSALALLVHGAARNVVGTTAVTMMQLLAPEHARGRVMSLNTLLAGGLRPLGDFGLSAAMMATSVAGITVLCAGLVGLCTFALNMSWPSIKVSSAKTQKPSLG